MLIYETTERNDKNNWVKNRLIQDGVKIIEFEGYTIKNNVCTGLFDRRLFLNSDFLNYTDEEIHNILVNEEPNLSAKIDFANKLNTYYRYVFYSYELEKVLVYRFENNKLKFKACYDNFCSFINETQKLRDLKMTSSYQEDNLPRIDKIFRDTCGLPWMGNLDAAFLSNDGQSVALLVEFQTTIKKPVALHCNNDFFAPTRYRKGDELRWKVFDTLSIQSGLDLVIIVWSPNEVNGDIKYKVVDHIVYSESLSGERPGLRYKRKDIINYEQLLNQFYSEGLI
ncbi:hypothetical protein [Vibrio diabolicus]|uniref:hypothetical protein n=1 Tax=Vibrio diabolicus TaxID=50719 RepID=UPI0022A9B833|nr:hypothetical protein [Vibrio diabolicus]MCZ2369623.1 hypothetical protein [Vibrio diabolicus]